MAACSICEDTEVNKHTKLGICDACYAGLQYWKGRSVGDLIKRVAQVERLNKRFAFMTVTRTNASKRSTKRR